MMVNLNMNLQEMVQNPIVHLKKEKFSNKFLTKLNMILKTINLTIKNLFNFTLFLIMHPIVWDIETFIKENEFKRLKSFKYNNEIY